MRDGRERILEAAGAAFAERGYAATSMSDLRRASGASTGSLYHHFASKEHVAAALFLDALGSFQDGFAAVLEARPGDARAGVREGVRFLLRWIEERPERARLLVAELDPAVSAAAADELAARNRAFFARVRAWVDAAVGRGALRALDGELIYALWLGPAQEHARAWLAGRARATPGEAAGALADGAWRALAVAP